MSLKIDAKTTALVLIDMQKGILSRPLAPYSAAELIEKMALFTPPFKKAGGALILVNVAFSKEGKDRLLQPVDAPMPIPEGGLPPGWSEIVPEIDSLGADSLVTKKQWGAFFGTDLDLQLRRRGIKTIILGGLVTNFGVEFTAREAWQHNYGVIIAEDMCSSATQEMHDFSIKNVMPRISLVRQTKEILSVL